MPLEFALRPRIKIAEGFAAPRRSRFRAPKLMLQVLAYWLTAAGITYALIRAHSQPEAIASAQSLAAPADTRSEQPWWQPVPAASARAAAPDSEPGPSPASISAPEPTAAEAALREPSLAEPSLAEPAFDAQEAAATEPEERHGKSGVNRPHDEAAPDTLADARAPAHDEIRARELFQAPSVSPERPGATPPLLGATPPDAPAAVASALPSCEAAALTANQEVDIGRRENAPDLSREAIAAVLDNGVWIARCDIPMSSSIELCVAIKGGAVIGATVTSHPSNAAINACVKRRAAGLRFPFSSRVDLAKTHF